MIILLLIASISSQSIQIGQDPEQIDQSFSIQLDEKSLRLKFCSIVSDNQKGITKKDFNYPNQQKFLSLNQKLLLQYVSGDILTEMENKSALIYYDNWKCKQYTIYNYISQKYEFEANSSKNRIMTILRNEKQETRLFKDCQSWNYILKLNSKTQDQSVNLFCNENKNNITYQYERTLIGAGLHQFIETKIIFNEEIKKDIVIIDELDTFTYVDKDELDKLPYETKLMTIVDIERPNELSTQHIVLSKHQGKKTLTYVMPYHFRYHLASNQHYKTSYVPNVPRVYLQDGDQGGDQFLLDHFSKNYVPLQPEKFEQHLIYEIPVGYLPYKNIVFIITIGLTLGIAIHLARMMMNEKI